MPWLRTRAIGPRSLADRRPLGYSRSSMRHVPYQRHHPAAETPIDETLPVLDELTREYRGGDDPR